MECCGFYVPSFAPRREPKRLTSPLLQLTFGQPWTFIGDLQCVLSVKLSPIKCSRRREIKSGRVLKRSGLQGGGGVDREPQLMQRGSIRNKGGLFSLSTGRRLLSLLSYSVGGCCRVWAEEILNNNLGCWSLCLSTILFLLKWTEGADRAANNLLMLRPTLDGQQMLER